MKDNINYDLTLETEPSFVCIYQKRAEKYEGDEVGVGEGAATLGLRVP